MRPRARCDKGEPGTPAFRVALRDAIVSTKEVVGTHGVYNFKAGNLYGVDERARVIVKLDNGAVEAGAPERWRDGDVTPTGASA